MENFLQIKLAVIKKILVKAFPGARIKAMKHYVSPDLEKKTDVVILHTGTNNLKSASSAEEIANEITSLALSLKAKRPPDCSFKDSSPRR